MGNPDCVVIKILFRLIPHYSIKLKQASHGFVWIISGLNLAQMLGDKFLKKQEACFSSEPYISQVVCTVHTSSKQSFCSIG